MPESISLSASYMMAAASRRSFNNLRQRQGVLTGLWAGSMRLY